MAHEVETMAFAHETPWHGLGVRVSPDMTPDEFLVAAGLNWQVEKRPLFLGDQADPEHALPSATPLSRRFGLVRATDGRLFDIVGKDWKPVQNAKVFEFFQHFCKEGGATMETAGALKNGAWVWGLANLGSSFKLPNGDAVKGYLLLATAHQQGFATIGKVTPIRVVCANTFAMSGGFEAESQIRVPHTDHFEPAQAAESMELAREGMFEFERNARLLQSLNLSRQEATNLLLPIYQPKLEPEKVHDIMAKPESEFLPGTIASIFHAARTGPGADQSQPEPRSKADFTGWGLFNGATYHANHKARGANDNRFASTLVGSNNANLNRIWRGLVKLAA